MISDRNDKRHRHCRGVCAYSSHFHFTNSSPTLWPAEGSKVANICQFSNFGFPSPRCWCKKAPFHEIAALFAAGRYLWQKPLPIVLLPFLVLGAGWHEDPPIRSFNRKPSWSSIDPHYGFKRSDPQRSQLTLLSQSCPGGLFLKIDISSFPGCLCSGECKRLFLD